MKFIINYICLAAVICYGSNGVLGAPVNTFQLAPRQIDTSLDIRESGLSRREPLAPRTYNEALNARAVDGEAQLYPRRRRGPRDGLTRSQRQDQEKAAIHGYTTQAMEQNAAAAAANQAAAPKGFGQRLKNHWMVQKAKSWNPFAKKT